MILINNACRLKDLSYAIVNSMHLRALVFFTFPLSLAGKHACMYFLSLRNMRLGARFHLIMSKHRAYGRPKRESRGCNVYFCTTTVRYVKEGGRLLLARTMSAANRLLPAALERESSFLRRLCISRFASRRLQRWKNSRSRLHSALSEMQASFFPLLSFGAYFLHDSRNDVFRDFY